MPAVVKLPSTSCECYEGRPGSGKSFIAADKAREFIIRERRPVFTNLPINERVFRQWLRNRGGDALARLYFPLTEQHFKAFLVRADERAKFLAAAKAHAVTQQRTFRRLEAERTWYELHGPDVLAGEGANWVSRGALVIIDEAHLWFPQTDQKRGEMSQLLRYTTMYRHFLHTIWYITQDRMQVSLSLRRQTAWYWHVRNAAEEKIGVWNIRGKHLGMYAFQYEKFSPEAEDAQGGEAAEPVERMWKFYWLPNERWKFRLYQSFTHAGGVQGMMRELAAMRAELGITEVPKHLQERTVDVKWYYAALGCAAMLASGLLLGRSLQPAPKPAAIANVAGATNVDAPAGVPAGAGKPWHTGVSLGLVSGDSVSVNGRRVKVGATFGGSNSEQVRVLALERKTRSVFVLCGDDVYRWVRGDPAPTRVGSTADVLQRRAKQGG